MGTSLVLAVGAVDAASLRELVEDRIAAGGTVHVVVPASRIRGEEAAGLLSERARWPGEHPDVSSARWRLRQLLDAWRRQGITADGEVGAADPVRAVRDAAARTAATEVIVAPPRGRPRWAPRDLSRRLRRAVELPVVVPETASADAAP